MWGSVVALVRFVVVVVVVVEFAAVFVVVGFVGVAWSEGDNRVVLNSEIKTLFFFCIFLLFTIKVEKKITCR